MDFSPLDITLEACLPGRDGFRCAITTAGSRHSSKGREHNTKTMAMKQQVRQEGRRFLSHVHQSSEWTFIKRPRIKSLDGKGPPAAATPVPAPPDSSGNDPPRSPVKDYLMGITAALDEAPRASSSSRVQPPMRDDSFPPRRQAMHTSTSLEAGTPTHPEEEGDLPRDHQPKTCEEHLGELNVEHEIEGADLVLAHQLVLVRSRPAVEAERHEQEGKPDDLFQARERGRHRASQGAASTGARIRQRSMCVIRPNNSRGGNRLPFPSPLPTYAIPPWGHQYRPCFP